MIKSLLKQNHSTQNPSKREFHLLSNNTYPYNQKNQHRGIQVCSKLIVHRLIQNQDNKLGLRCERV